MVMPYRRLLETRGIDDHTTSSSYTNNTSNESEFDTNMVIILTVLLCALIVALALNFLAPCGLRYILSARSSESQSEAPAGLKKRALRRLPQAVYRTGVGPNDFLVTECSICLGQFLDGEKIRVLPKCGHGFHVGCIDTWLVSNASCPNCRTSLLEPADSYITIRQAALDNSSSP